MTFFSSKDFRFFDEKHELGEEKKKWKENSRIRFENDNILSFLLYTYIYLFSSFHKRIEIFQNGYIIPLG